MKEDKITDEDVNRILEFVKAAPEINELRLCYGGMEIHLRKEGVLTLVPRTEPAAATQPSASHSPPEPRAAAAKPTAPADTNGLAVTSPMVGTFYRAPEPGATPFASVGQRVVAGDTLCIVEVMKLMNTIQAPRAGVIKDIYVGDGEVVEYGQRLMLIDPD